MGKFVTYGVTETLDNDQKFIIDSDRTGPGSITAKDAASSLLSKWAGFETFEEAVQNTISNNQEFIDRDTAIRNETAELKKKIVTTFPAKDASGAVATFESEFEDAPLKSCIVRVEPVQDLHGYDSPWPAGGGTNQWDEELEIGSFDSHGNPTTSSSYMRSKNYIPLIPNATYYFTRPSIIAWVYYYTDTDYIEYVQLGSGVKTFTPPSNATRAKFLVATSTYGTTYNHDIAINYPSSVTTYSPYSNICPISGFTGCEVQRTGKNLAKLPTSGGRTNSGITWTYNADGTATATGTATFNSWAYSPTIQFSIPEGTYTLSVSEPFRPILYINHERVKDSTTRYRTFTVTETATIGINISVLKGTTINTATGIQLELGSTATPYVPYTGQTYPIAFPTEAGTVYGAYVDVTGGELVVDRAMVDLGTLNWVKNANSRYGYAGTHTPQKRSGITNIICDTLKTSTSSSASSMEAYSIKGRSYDSLLFARIEDDMTQTQFMEWMNGKYAVYELAEPIHYPLTPTEIKTLLGINNIWSNTGDTSVEYFMPDVSWYVEKKLKAFQSVLAGVEDSAVASKNYSTNTYLIFNDDIYRVTKTITAGETIEEGVNVTKTTVAEQLMALAQA